MAWLSGWDKRIKITVSNTNIDSDLTHFPLLLTLGTSVGTGNTDVSCIFDELQADANRKKIAVTKDDGETEIYVEIEKWDDGNEKAWLWVSKSDLVFSSSGTTDLYIYYDIDHADNDTYVGDVGGRTEVWDSNFKLVYHCSEATHAQLIDSTSNNNDSTTNTLDSVAGKIGPGLDGDGTEWARAAITTIVSDQPANCTISCWGYVTDQPATGYIFHNFSTAASGSNGYLDEVNYTNASSVMSHRHIWAETNFTWGINNDTMTNAEWYHFANVLATDVATLYRNAVPYANTAALGGTNRNWAASTGLTLGGNRNASPAGIFKGGLDEVRVSETNRPVAWIKADYHGGSDNLVSWGSEETASVGTNFQINISDSWKAISKAQINISDSWKAVTKVQININDVWKTIF